MLVCPVQSIIQFLDKTNLILETNKPFCPCNMDQDWSNIRLPFLESKVTMELG